MVSFRLVYDIWISYTEEDGLRSNTSISVIGGQSDVMWSNIIKNLPHLKKSPPKGDIDE